MVRVPQTTECPDKTPQIHDLCSVLFDRATDHVINNGKSRNTQSEVGEAISPRQKIASLLKNDIHKSSWLIDLFKWHLKFRCFKSWQYRYLCL